MEFVLFSSAGLVGGYIVAKVTKYTWFKRKTGARLWGFKPQWYSKWLVKRQDKALAKKWPV